MKMSDYLNKLEQLYNKTKFYVTQMSENILAYRLLKSANLPEPRKQMVKGTISYLKFNLMKDQLKKTFGKSLPSIEKCPIKTGIPSMLNMLVETITRNCTKVTSLMMKKANNKKHTLQATHREHHNNTHTRAPQNNSSRTKEKIRWYRYALFNL